MWCPASCLTRAHTPTSNESQSDANVQARRDQNTTTDSKRQPRAQRAIVVSSGRRADLCGSDRRFTANIQKFIHLSASAKRTIGQQTSVAIHLGNVRILVKAKSFELTSSRLGLKGFSRGLRPTIISAFAGSSATILVVETVCKALA